MAREIVPAVVLPLTKGFVTLVDPDVAEWASKLNWFVQGTYPHIYAVRVRGGGVNRQIQLHRLIMNPPDGFIVDHINGMTLDNRRCNLRVCTQAENMRNFHSPVGAKAKGVRYDAKSKLWRATVHWRGKTAHLGCFRTEDEARSAYALKVADLEAKKTDLSAELEVRERKPIVGASYIPSINKWKAQIERRGVKYFLGSFDTREEAHAAYLAKKAELDS